jgi:hypothetical protein
MFGIGMISLLYNAHNAARGTDGVVDAEKRATAARPLLARLFGWARVEHRIRTDGDPMKTAVGYLVCQRRVLTRFLHDGALRLDTIPAELELRREVVGRKNWLFVGNDGAAEWNTEAVSLIARGQMHGVDPWAYLRDVLTLLPVWNRGRVLELAPKSRVQTREQPETQRLLGELDLLRRACPMPKKMPQTPRRRPDAFHRADAGCRGRVANAAEHLSRVRHLVLTLMKLAGGTWVGLGARRYMAMGDDDYLARVLKLRATCDGPEGVPTS